MYAVRHAPKGPPSREVVSALVDDGLTTQQMAERLGIGATTVRYWLRKYELKTAPLADPGRMPASAS